MDILKTDEQWLTTWYKSCSPNLSTNYSTKSESSAKIEQKHSKNNGINKILGLRF